VVDKVGCMYGGGMSFARRVRFLLTPGLVESSTWMICTTSTSKEAGHACAKVEDSAFYLGCQNSHYLYEECRPEIPRAAQVRKLTRYLSTCLYTVHTLKPRKNAGKDCFPYGNDRVQLNTSYQLLGLPYTVHWNLYINKHKPLALISEASQIRT